MADVHSKNTRSYNMSCIKAKDTKPEIIVRRFLFSKGFRYRLNYKKLPGKPDLVFPKYKKALFVNGCFWHGHEGCKYFVIPKTRTEWWLQKINENKARDKRNMAELIKLNWEPIIIWECELKSSVKREQTLSSLVEKIWKK